MFGNIFNLFKKKSENEENKSTAKERLHLVLMQDRANVSADFLDLMKQEIIEVIKKYIEVDENQIDVKLTNKINGDGTTGAPALYANIPIKNLKKETRINLNKELLKEHDGSNSENNATDTAETGNDIEIVEIKEENNVDEGSKEDVKNETVENENKSDEEKNGEIQTAGENANANEEQKDKNASDKTEEDVKSNNEEKQEGQKEADNSAENKNKDNGNNKKKNRKNKKSEGTTFFENIKEDNKTDEK